MNKVVIASVVALSALIMGAALWERDRGLIPNQSAEETPPSPTSSEEPQYNSSTRKLDKSEQTEAAYSHLFIWFAMVPNEATARMGYYDEEAKSFYAWKGVIVRAEQIPGYNAMSARIDPFDIRALTVKEVPPPPTYYMPLPDGEFAPGFYGGRFAPRFYRWKGIHLKKEQIPADVFKKHVLPKRTEPDAIIDPPQFLLK